MTSIKSAYSLRFSANIEFGLVVALSTAIAVAFATFFESTWPESVGFVLTLVTVYLVTKENALNWPIGIASSILYVVAFYQVKLYAESLLSLYFGILGVVGWFQWTRRDPITFKGSLRISKLTSLQWALSFGAILVLSIPLYLTSKHFGGALPHVDAPIAAASVVAQIMVNQKKIENWMLWIVIDVVAIFAYIDRQFYTTAGLYAFLCFLAILGWKNWAASLRTEAT